MLENVGFSDKFDVQPLDRLQMPTKFHGISLQTTDLGAYRTPNLAKLMLLFLLLFKLIFTASKA